MSAWTLLVTLPADPEERRLVEDELPGSVAARYLDDLEPDEHPAAVAGADALLSRLPHEELSDAAFEALHAGQFVQAVSAGVDHLPLERFPDGLTLLSNAGAYAEPMAEHVLAMYLALSKRLPVEHRKMAAGEFDQFRPNRRVAGSTCGILGFGAVGEASAGLLRRLDVSILAINRSGESSVETEFLGTPDDLEHVLRRCDGLVVAAPLTPETRGVIDREKLSWMADDAMVVNVARGELFDQRDLYEHLRDHPEFLAGIDAWWTEPVRHGEFALEYPFLELPNVLGSPHNSAQVPDVRLPARRRAVRNVARALTGGEPANVVDRELGY